AVVVRARMARPLLRPPINTHHHADALPALNSSTMHQTAVTESNTAKLSRNSMPAYRAWTGSTEQSPIATKATLGPKQRLENAYSAISVRRLIAKLVPFATAKVASRDSPGTIPTNR